MSYSVFLFRKEVKENNQGFDFLENEALIMPFSEHQFEKLKSKLLKYGYQIEYQTPELLKFNYRDGQYGIEATLSKTQLSFSSDFSENGIFEISQTASEFADDGELKKLDPQSGGWEEF